MAIDANHVSVWNAAYARLPLSDQRSADLALELDQLQRAVERLRDCHLQPDDLLDFHAVLLGSTRTGNS